MACIRKRRGKWVVDYRDSAGVRRWVTCATKQEAEDALAKKIPESRQRVRPVLDLNITVETYAERWLLALAPTVKPRTMESYRANLQRHILPKLGSLKLRLFHKEFLKTFLAEKLAAGLSRSTVRLLLCVVRALLSSAVDDDVLAANPALGLGRKLKLGQREGPQMTHAMTPAQLATVLAAARRVVPRYFPLFLCLARTGLRFGEAAGLQWSDLDLRARELHVQRTFSKGRIGTPKSGQARRVDLSRELTTVLRRLELERKAEALKRGWPGMPPWVFVSSEGHPLSEPLARAAFLKTLKAAKLPHFRLHDLRHTYAVHMLQNGASPAYVKDQLGHSSIQVTVDVYGRWLPTGDKSAVDRLDGLARPAMVASGSRFGESEAEPLDFPAVGSAPSRTRGCTFARSGPRGGECPPAAPGAAAR